MSDGRERLGKMLYAATYPQTGEGGWRFVPPDEREAFAAGAEAVARAVRAEYAPLVVAARRAALALHNYGLRAVAEEVDDALAALDGGEGER